MLKKEREDVMDKNIPFDSPLIVHEITKIFKSKGTTITSLDNITFHIEKDEFLVLLGPNGAGKTTLFNILCRLLNQSSGDFFYNGNKINYGEYCSSVGYCPQYDILYNKLTIEQHLMYYSRLKGCPSNLLLSYVDNIISDVGLQKEKKNRVSKLSTGQKRRLSIAIALTGNPSILLLDEPTTGLDSVTRKEIWNLLIKLKKYFNDDSCDGRSRSFEFKDSNLESRKNQMHWIS